MKKITLTMFAVAAFGFVANAQSLSETSLSSNTFTPNGGEDIVFDQPVGGSTGIVSMTNNTNLVMCAEDFTLTESTKIDNVTIYGFNNNQNVPTNLLGVKFYIYADSGGAPAGDPTNPGSEEVFLDLVDGDPGLSYVDQGMGGYDFTVDVSTAAGSDVILPAGTYWVAFAPVLNVTDFLNNPADRYNWYMSDFSGTGNAVLIDPGDLFGLGVTTWASLLSLVGTVDSLAMTVEGTPATSVGDHMLAAVSIFPNPATDVINIVVPSGLEISNVSVFDVLGKNTGVSLVNGKVNISGLQKGIYIVNVETNYGTLTQKLVKR